jgi:hypothetical protein
MVMMTGTAVDVARLQPGDRVLAYLALSGRPAYQRPVEGVVREILNTDQFEFPVLVEFPDVTEGPNGGRDFKRYFDAPDFWMWFAPAQLRGVVRQ